MPAPHAELKKQFTDIFEPGGKIHIVRAPGRVNLIGEHTDYNDGFVFPMAIEPQVHLVCCGRDDQVIRLASTAFPGDVSEFSIAGKIARGEPEWTNYIRGVAAGMLAAGIPLVGMDALISNTLPVGGGLSSSAAIEVAAGVAMLALVGVDMDRQRLALLCQKAEHDFAGVPVGIMDQTIVALGKADHAMLLDCRDLTKQFIELDKNEVRLVVANSMVKHSLGTSEYAQRRAQCEAGVAYFQKHYPGRSIQALRDVTARQVEIAAEKMDPVIRRRCRHVVTENERTTQAATLLAKKQYETVGELLVQSHNSLRDDYEVSVPELDYLVEESMKVKGVYGARMTGGGFGGCSVALAQPRAVAALEKHLKRVYPEKFGKEPLIFDTTATSGAEVIA